MRKTKEANNEYMREFRKKKKAQGICDLCTNPVVTGRVRCAKHLEYFRKTKENRDAKKENAKVREKRAALIAQGLCICCKQPSSKRLCKDCRQKDVQSANILRQKRIEMGLCKFCGKNKLSHETSKVCEICKCKMVARKNLGNVNHWEELKLIFDKQNICPYSGKQLILGVNATLDHIVSKFNGGTNDFSNLQWVYCGDDFDINFMKGKFSERDFLEAIKTIYDFRFKKEEK